jgi:hypothetical protein
MCNAGTLLGETSLISRRGSYSPLRQRFGREDQLDRVCIIHPDAYTYATIQLIIGLPLSVPL